MDYPIEIRICTRRIAMPDKESQKPNDLYRIKIYFSKWQMQKNFNWPGKIDNNLYSFATTD